MYTMNCKNAVEVCSSEYPGPPDVIELQKAIAEQRETIAKQRETIEYLEREIERMQKTINDEFG